MRPCRTSRVLAKLQPPNEVSVECCRSSAPWSVAHLTRLTELSLRGECGFRVMRELLESPAAPVLPATLRTLRLVSHDSLCFSAEER